MEGRWLEAGQSGGQGCGWGERAKGFRHLRVDSMGQQLDQPSMNSPSSSNQSYCTNTFLAQGFLERRSGLHQCQPHLYYGTSDETQVSEGMLGQPPLASLSRG